MNQNWIVENLNNAFSTWNGKLTELWGLVTTSPQTFKGGAVWGVMQSLHNAMIGIGYALIVLFFAISLFKNTANFHELKRPEAAVHYLIRFVAAKTLVGYGMDIMLNIFSVCNGIVSDMAAGMGGISQAMVALPGEVQSAIENVGFLASIPLWLVTILGSLFITVLSFVMILTVYGRFFRLYMYTALAPLPLASFAGESTQSVGISFIKSYVGVCLEGAVIVLACVIYAAFVSTPTVSGGEASLIAASLKNIYKPLIASGYTAPCPTLGDLYRDLNKSNLRRAKQLALMLDVFANGSLQAFSHTTNVDMNNRLICFNIQSLGDQLRPIAMMSLLEFINMQVMTNRRKDATAATWIYFDEIHVLLKDPMSSNFLYSSWKRFRKYNAYATGISQDIQDYLDNPVAYALLSNSEFVIMLRQSKSLEALERLYGLSKPQLEFLRNASEGHGIIKMGNSMIPFSNLEPKDTAVYKLITTKPGEATAEE